MTAVLDKALPQQHSLVCMLLDTLHITKRRDLFTLTLHYRTHSGSGVLRPTLHILQPLT